jgi:outer membrane protein assembly factor BamB
MRAAIVVGQQLFLAVAESESQTQSVLCLDKATGQQLWSTVVHRGTSRPRQREVHARLIDARLRWTARVYVNFLNDGAVYTTAADTRRQSGVADPGADLVMHQGFGSSPALYGDLVIVSADNKGSGAVAAFERDSGRERWRISRPKVPNYTSPIIFKIAGKDQLLLTGCDGRESWIRSRGKPTGRWTAQQTECVTSTVTDGNSIYTERRLSADHLAAVRAERIETDRLGEQFASLCAVDAMP